MSVEQPRVRYRDLQDAPDDGRHYEIYGGEVSVVPAPIPLHQVVVLNLEDRFRAWARRHGGVVLVSPIDIVFSDYDVVQPDLVFFAPGRQHLVSLREPIRAAPDIVIEVLSPSTAKTDRGRKMDLLARYGVPEYWIADADEETIEVYRLLGGRYATAQTAARGDIARSVTISGFECWVDEIFSTGAGEWPSG